MNLSLNEILLTFLLHEGQTLVALTLFIPHNKFFSIIHPSLLFNGVSSNIDMALFVNTSANTFVLGDLKVHYKTG